MFENISGIFYFHVLTPQIEKQIKLVKNKNTLIMADDGHISIKNHLNIMDYISVIGRCSCEISNVLKQDDESPLVDENLQSALYNSLIGFKEGFLKIDDIPIEKRLNHTYTHSKAINISTTNINATKFNKNNCISWWSYDKTNVKKGYILKSTPYHLYCYNMAIKEISKMFKYISEENKNIVVAPWNKINNYFVSAAEYLGIDYIIYSNVYDVKNKIDLGIPRINLEKI